MNNPYLTVDSILAMRPCNTYSRDHLEYLIGKRTRVRLSTALKDERIPPPDRVWLACNVLPISIVREFALAEAEAVLPIFEAQYPDDDRPRRCIEAAHRYLGGEMTKEEFASAAHAVDAARASAAHAADAARASAARAARASAARAAAHAAYAAVYAARAAAHAAAYAARASAADATHAATHAAAYAAARKRQLAWFLKVATIA